MQNNNIQSYSCRPHIHLHNSNKDQHSAFKSLNTKHSREKSFSFFEVRNSTLCIGLLLNLFLMQAEEWGAWRFAEYLDDRKRRNEWAYLHLRGSSARAQPQIRGWKQRIRLAMRQARSQFQSATTRHDYVMMTSLMDETAGARAQLPRAFVWTCSDQTGSR